jgi:hypothetical protein
LGVNKNMLNQNFPSPTAGVSPTISAHITIGTSDRVHIWTHGVRTPISTSRNEDHISHSADLEEYHIFYCEERGLDIV